MRIIKFSEERELVSNFLGEYFEGDLTNQPQKTTIEGFEIICVVDDITAPTPEEPEKKEVILYDYKIFDPHRNCFNGYLYGNGWSNWQCECSSFLEGELKEEWERVTEEGN